jgi:hypothetical protein
MTFKLRPKMLLELLGRLRRRSPPNYWRFARAVRDVIGARMLRAITGELSVEQPLCALLGRDQCQAGYVAAWMCKACDIARPERIARRSHDDRNGCSRMMQRLDRLRGLRNDHIDLCLHEFGSERWKANGIAIRKSLFENDGLSFDPSDLPQYLRKRSEAGLRLRGTLAGKHSSILTKDRHKS